MTPQQSPEGPEFDRYAVVTIQGGGVYGLSLLGQLRAALDAGLEPIALAGTSAGAVVATLYWAGLHPEEVRDLFATQADRPQGLINLIGPYGQGRERYDYRMFKKLGKSLKAYLTFVQRELVGNNGGAWERLLFWMWNLPWWVIKGVIGLRAFSRFAVVVGRRGFFPGDAFEAELDRMIRTSAKIRPHLESGRLPPAPGAPGGRLLTFGDLNALTADGLCLFHPLFLTATNLTTRQLELFDSTDPRYHAVPVARAVRASAGFPGFFRPVDLTYPDGEHSYVDGGVICNFPAFVFANSFRRVLARVPEYRPFLMRPWVHVGLRFSSARRPFVHRELRDPGAFARAMLGLVTGQARSQLEDRLSSFVSRTITVAQPFEETGGPGNVMDVDKVDRDTIGVMFTRGREFARKEFDSRGFHLPPETEINPELEALVRRAARIFGDATNAESAFRANIFVPSGSELVISYRANMDDPNLDTDRDLRLEYRFGLTGFCFVRRRPLVCNMELLRQAREDEGADPMRLFGLTKEIQDLVRKDRTWLVNVPIFDPYASYPRELSANPEVGVEGLHYVELGSPLDGAVFGVLNLDSSITYSKLGLDVNPETQILDDRVLTLIGIMRSAAMEIAKVFSDHFGAYRGGSQ